jgi:serine carboxypeptidase-like clade 2
MAPSERPLRRRAGSAPAALGVVLAALATLAAATTPAPDAAYLGLHRVAEISALPGYDAPLPSAMWSGYVTVNASHGRQLFFWFVSSERNASSDPLVLWTQGGPGCSSMIALFLENGPFVAGEGGQLQLNPFRWSRFANVLWVDSPLGAGFSFSQTPGDYNTDNNKTIADLTVFLQQWLQLFPSFVGRPLWLTGESYSGDYSLLLAQNIVANAGYPLASMLSGLAVGNPVISCAEWKASGLSVQVELFYWHGLIPFSAYMGWKRSGCDANNGQPGCDSFFNEINALVGDYDGDNLYTDFVSGNASLGVGPTPPHTLQLLLNMYLNAPAVQAAIGAVPTNWTSCCDEDGQDGTPCLLNYTTTWDDMLPVYRFLFTNAPHVRVLVYSGDTDIATVPHAYTQLCLGELGQKPLTAWTPWQVPGTGQTAGYLEIYPTYAFATLKGAGHEAPMFAPLASFQLIHDFIFDTGIFRAAAPAGARVGSSRARRARLAVREVGVGRN